MYKKSFKDKGFTTNKTSIVTNSNDKSSSVSGAKQESFSATLKSTNSLMDKVSSLALPGKQTMASKQSTVLNSMKQPACEVFVNKQNDKPVSQASNEVHKYMQISFTPTNYKLPS